MISWSGDQLMLEDKEIMIASHAQIGAKLLRDAAQFFLHVAEQNEELKTQMEENALVYKQFADLLENDPNGRLEM